MEGSPVCLRFDQVLHAYLLNFCVLTGLGELSFFYVYAIFYLTGLMMSCFFLLCCYLRFVLMFGVVVSLFVLLFLNFCCCHVWFEALGFPTTVYFYLFEGSRSETPLHLLNIQIAITTTSFSSRVDAQVYISCINLRLM